MFNIGQERKLSQLANLENIVGMEYFINTTKHTILFKSYRNNKPQANNNKIVTLNFIKDSSQQTFKNKSKYI